MNHIDRLVKKSLEEKSKIPHRLDDAVLTAMSFEKYGFDPYFKKYEGIKLLTWGMSNREPVFNEFFEKLVEIEPLFKNVSSHFKRYLQNSFFSKFDSFFSKCELYVDIEKMNWNLIYTDFRGFPSVKEQNYTKDDFLLIKLLDQDYVKALREIMKLHPNLYKDYDRVLKIEDPILYHKLNPNKAS